MDMGLSKLREMVMDREVWRAVIHGVAKSRTWLSDWTELTEAILLIDFSLSNYKLYSFIFIFIFVSSKGPASLREGYNRH